MKHCIPLLAFLVTSSLASAEVPKVFGGLFEQDIPIKGQIGMVLPPPEIDKYVAKVETAARQDPKWFREYSSKSKPGVPLPFDERLGLTKEEYAEYIALWNKREFKPVEEVMMMLRKNSSGTWSFTATGKASTISTLRYDDKGDIFQSPNGELKRLEDINADASSILGAWTGHEWKFEEETSLGKTKENIAFGRFAGDKYGIIVYRAVEFSTEGTRLLDKSLVIRFPLGKAGQIKESKPSTGSTASKTKTGKPAK